MYAKQKVKRNAHCTPCIMVAWPWRASEAVCWRGRGLGSVGANNNLAKLDLSHRSTNQLKMWSGVRLQVIRQQCPLTSPSENLSGALRGGVNSEAGLGVRMYLGVRMSEVGRVRVAYRL